MPARFSSRLQHLRRTAGRSLIAGIAVGALLLPAAPSVAAAPICERTFGGDATGSRDVTSSLASFLRNHDGKRLCLRKNGTYRVDGTVRVANVNGLRLNGRNALLRPVSSSSASAQRQQLKIEAGRNVVIRNIRIRGANSNHTSYVENRQHEHGIALYGGYDIKVIDVTVTDTYGDGIYVSYIPGKISPPSTVKVKRATVSRVGRNGIAVVGGRWIVITQGFDLEDRPARRRCRARYIRREHPALQAQAFVPARIRAGQHLYRLCAGHRRLGR